jgi:hypothetical protein
MSGDFPCTPEKKVTPFRIIDPIWNVRQRRKGILENQVPEYGLEALVSTIDDKEEMIAAIKESRKRSLL